jgi:glycerol-3-phosphate dehydrogenase
MKMEIKLLGIAFKKGFEYSDCITDDARLTVLNAADAKRLGGNINTRTMVENIEQKKASGILRS